MEVREWVTTKPGDHCTVFKLSRLYFMGGSNRRDETILDDMGPTGWDETGPKGRCGTGQDRRNGTGQGTGRNRRDGMGETGWDRQDGTGRDRKGRNETA